MRCYSTKYDNCDDSFHFMFDGATDPFSLLGMKEDATGLFFRAWLPDVSQAWLVDKHTGRRQAELKISAVPGLLTARLPRRKRLFNYFIEVKKGHSHVLKEDPYSFGMSLSIAENKLLENEKQCFYTQLGAHPLTLDGVNGIRFAVRAPSARQVSLVGECGVQGNYCHPMRLNQNTGVWSVFLPGVEAISVFQYRIRQRDGSFNLISDPYVQSSHSVGEITDITDGSEHSDAKVFAICIETIERIFSHAMPRSKLISAITSSGFTHLALITNRDNTGVRQSRRQKKWGYARIMIGNASGSLLKLAREVGLKTVISQSLLAAPCADAVIISNTGDRRDHQPDIYCHAGRVEQARCIADNPEVWMDCCNVDGLYSDNALVLRDNRRVKKFVFSDGLLTGENSVSFNSPSCLMTSKPILSTGCLFLPSCTSGEVTLPDHVVHQQKGDIAEFFKSSGICSINKMLAEYFRADQRYDMFSAICELQADMNNCNNQARLRASLALLWSCPGSKIISGIADEMCTDASSWFSYNKNLLVLLHDLNDFSPVHKAQWGPECFKWLLPLRECKPLVAFSLIDAHDNHFIVVANYQLTSQSGYRLPVDSEGEYTEILNTDSSFYGGINRGNMGDVVAQDMRGQNNKHEIIINIPPLTTIYFIRRKEYPVSQN